MTWSAEEMLGWQSQTVDIPAHARIAYKGLLQKYNNKKERKRISAESSHISTEMNWTER